jgi:hypothetical protein
VLHLIVSVHTLALAAERRVVEALRRRGDGGQSTAEYALVLLGAAGVAVLLMTWTSRTDRVTRLLNGILDKVMGLAS